MWASFPSFNTNIFAIIRIQNNSRGAISPLIRSGISFGCVNWKLMPIIWVKLPEFHKNSGTIVSARCMFWIRRVSHVRLHRKISMFTLKHTQNYNIIISLWMCVEKELHSAYLTSVVAMATSAPIRSKMRRTTSCTRDGTQSGKAACISIVIPFFGNPRHLIWSAGIGFPIKQPELFAYMRDFVKLRRLAKDAEKARFWPVICTLASTLFAPQFAAEVTNSAPVCLMDRLYEN